MRRNTDLEDKNNLSKFENNIEITKKYDKIIIMRHIVIVMVIVSCRSVL